jgi:cellulose synthase/poly-beta-1,6-N-acetylglucosamine synthase-like glycosyltransferase
VKTILHFGGELLFVYCLLANLSYLILLVGALVANSKHHFRRRSVRLESLKQSPFLEPVSVLVPARNEELTIVESVQALLDLDYPELEVIVINDGSTDETLQKLRAAYELRDAKLLYVSEIATAPVRSLYVSRKEPHLIVIDKQNGGSKADAVNAGINAATGAFVCIVDADSILEQDALIRIMSAVHTDTAVVAAAGGIVRVLNGCTVRAGRIDQIHLPKQRLEILQIVEYLRAFLVGREGWAKFDMLPLVSGAFGVFRTQLVRRLGGLRREATGEDLDLVIRMHRHLRETGQPYRIAFVPDPTCWTEVPTTLSGLSSQRSRWQRGLFEVLWQNRDMLFRWRYGRIGLVLLPYLVAFELFEPVIEAIGYVSLLLGVLLGAVDRHLLAAVLLFGYAFATLISIGSVLLEEMTCRRYQHWRDVARLILFCFYEHFPYRQIHLVWRLRGIWQFFLGIRSWEPIKRRGFLHVQAGVCATPLDPRKISAPVDTEESL